MKIEPCYKTLGKYIKDARTTHELNQTTLAKKLGISRPSLANIELGRQRIYLHHVLKLEKLLKVNLLNKLTEG